MMYVYSGNVRACQVGLPTPFVDVREKPIRTGDIVAVYYEDHNGEWRTDLLDHFTVALAFNFDCYFGQAPVKKEVEETPFIMGYKSMVLRKEPESTETVLFDDRKSVGIPDGIAHLVRVKAFEDVISGEHWPEFGFNYREVAE